MSAALRILTGPRLAEPTPCGSLWVRVNGASCALRCSGALWLEDERALVAADLHLEKGSAYAARGQLLPPYDTDETLRRLEAEIAALDPRMVVLLGDSFHDAKALLRMDAAQRARLDRLARGRRLVWVEGNHDLALLGALAAELPGEVCGETRLATLMLRHEPQAGEAAGETAGHLHPCVRIAGGRGRRRAFVTDGARLLLPAFGAYAGGLDVHDRAIASLFASPPLLGAIGERRVHPLAWAAV